MSDHPHSSAAEIPPPVQLYQELLRHCSDTMAGWVPLIRCAERAVETTLPAEPVRSALAESESPETKSVGLELWHVSDCLIGDTLMPAIALMRQLASATPDNPAGEPVDVFALWRELDPTGAPSERKGA